MLQSNKFLLGVGKPHVGRWTVWVRERTTTVSFVTIQSLLHPQPSLDSNYWNVIRILIWLKSLTLIFTDWHTPWFLRIKIVKRYVLSAFPTNRRWTSHLLLIKVNSSANRLQAIRLTVSLILKWVFVLFCFFICLFCWLSDIYFIAQRRLIA